jgi:hypothetical protein
MDSMPKTTRLRFVSARDPLLLVQWCNMIGVRVQVYGQPVVGPDEKWYLWFVPSDSGKDIPSKELD